VLHQCCQERQVFPLGTGSRRDGSSSRVSDGNKTAAAVLVNQTAETPTLAPTLGPTNVGEIYETETMTKTVRFLQLSPRHWAEESLKDLCQTGLGVALGIYRFDRMPELWFPQAKVTSALEQRRAGGIHVKFTATVPRPLWESARKLLAELTPEALEKSIGVVGASKGGRVGIPEWIWECSFSEETKNASGSESSMMQFVIYLVAAGTLCCGALLGFWTCCSSCCRRADKVDNSALYALEEARAAGNGQGKEPISPKSPKGGSFGPKAIPGHSPGQNAVKSPNNRLPPMSPKSLKSLKSPKGKNGKTGFLGSQTV